MLTISMFFGIIISMFVGKKEHNTPHFHARYQDYNAIFNLEGELIEGEMPIRQRKFIEVWADDIDIDPEQLYYDGVEV